MPASFVRSAAVISFLLVPSGIASAFIVVAGPVSATPLIVCVFATLASSMSCSVPRSANIGNTIFVVTDRSLALTAVTSEIVMYLSSAPGLAACENTMSPAWYW